MSIHLTTEYLTGLVNELCKLPLETEWIEFKHNNTNPEEIGEYISALANSAALSGKVNAYLIWGIEDKTHIIIGTTFNPITIKVGNEELENWLLQLLTPKIHFNFYKFLISGNSIVLLEISAAFRHPVQFKSQEFIRVGSYKKKLKDYPEKERELWRIFDQIPFEHVITNEYVSNHDILEMLYYQDYFTLLELPVPERQETILCALKDENLIQSNKAGSWDITNLGAILFAKNLNEFPKLKRKEIRVIHYEGKGRIRTLREQSFNQGYAGGFSEIIRFIMALLPMNEVIKHALRKSIPMFPELAVRELVANALIHQDFFATGVGPMVEIFEDRMEITSPGKPLIDTRRFLDTPPKSRNEALAFLMRRLRICEERGSGVDKVILQVELLQLPAPLFEVIDGFTRVVLFSHRSLTRMDKEDRIRACYMHACLKRVMRDYLTNASLRERFGIEEKNKAIISRYISEAVDAGMIKPHDDTAAKKMMKYVPYWV